MRHLNTLNGLGVKKTGLVRHQCVTAKPMKNRPSFVRLCWIPAMRAYTRGTKPLMADTLSWSNDDIAKLRVGLNVLVRVFRI